ncbi:tRNA-guanine(15) transglycosylase-like protein [Aspergillus pseudoustus]|uniref:Queuine tRNA-ribosyltransferase accessory subunit 2 n=1 Tax=Aspergillus pseudoustus TaxID=1810923 RepID=A0ABR4K197_9EURO
MGSDNTEDSPNEMFKFSLLGSAAAVLAPRLGRLAIAGRKPISTPHYVPLTSRGMVPHLAHDVMRDSTAIGSLFMEKEQSAKKSSIPIPLYAVPTKPHESALRKFTCLPDDILLILGARREPPIPCAPSNTPSSIAILTSVGFAQLSATQYAEATQKLSPDIVVGLSDLTIGQTPGIKRRAKMVDRTHAFTTHGTEALLGPDLSEHSRSNAAYFAPILPLENTEQQIYLEDLETDLRPFISGLALYEPASLSIVPEELGDLPRLLFSGPTTPHDILREVSLGADLLTLPFISLASDTGVAFKFVFPAPTNEGTQHSSEPLPLADDLWSTSYTTDTAPLDKSCSCYTCQNHHRAYIHHLLSAKEMLAWTLLQIHNHHVMDQFFAAIRESIERGTFKSDTQRFYKTYASEFPQATGEGPRLRGYKLPTSGPSQPRRYPPAYGKLELAAEKYAETTQADSSVATPDTGADGLEEHGFAEKVRISEK